MQPNNNNNDFRQIRALTAAVGLAILAFHVYYFCYQALASWGLTHPIIDRVTVNLAHSGLFNRRPVSKLIALVTLAGTTLGIRVPKQVKSWRRLLVSLSASLLLYFGSDVLLDLEGTPSLKASIYLICMITGLILLYIGIRSIAGFLYFKYYSDIFNQYSESFPQEERLLKNPYSINLKARYTFRNQVRDSYVNLPDIFRGTLVLGTPGSGKSRYIFRQLIQQSLNNGMAAFIFDLKYDDLSRLAYNTLLNVKKSLPDAPAYYAVVLDNPSLSNRCNPIPAESLDDISDASDSAKTILFALNKSWITRQGDFFISSAIAFFTANIWFLRQIEGGRYCTLPHLIELINTDFAKLFSVLRSLPDTDTLIGSFVSAFTNNIMEQLQGQIDSARIALSFLTSPELYYLLSGNDFTLDINNPNAPKVVCIGSNPQKQHIYGAVVSLYVSRMIKLVNKKGGRPCHLFFDEFSSFYASGMDLTLATARSNKVAVTIGIQDLSQLRKEYGRDQADALFNLPANLICGQVSGDSARLVSERFGKILQEKSTINTNSREISTSQSQQLDLALPPSKISTLSSGEFVGITADTPAQKMTLKAFHGRIQVDHKAIEKEEAAYQSRPDVRKVTRDLKDSNFLQIKKDVRRLVDTRLEYMKQTTGLAELILTQKEGKQHKQSPD